LWLPACRPTHRRIKVPQFDPQSAIPGGNLSDEDIAKVLRTFVTSSDESHHQKTKKVHTQKKNIFQALYQKILDGILCSNVCETKCRKIRR
jgi:hypothetical protein